MSKKELIGVLDGGLKPLGFHRKGVSWNRPVENFIDVVSLQVSKAGDQFFVNIGIAEPDLYRMCWGENIPAQASESHCVVATRLGRMRTGKDALYLLGSTSAGAEALRQLDDEGVPFMRRMHSHSAMRQFLIDANVEKRPYPPPRIFLALLTNEIRMRSEACAMLGSLSASVGPAWKPRVEAARLAISCGE